MKRIASRIGKYNLVSLAIIVALWAVALTAHGIAGACTYTIMTMFLPFAGIALSLVCVVAVALRALRRKCITTRLAALAISVLLTLPILISSGTLPVAYPVSEAQSQPAATVRWPLSEPATIGWGGNTVSQNYHAAQAFMRFAYDIVKEPFDCGTSSNADYGIWGQGILCPADGVVVGCSDGENDIAPNTDTFTSQLGNHVFIKMDATQTYLVLAHMMNGSVAVKLGDRVVAGDTIGKVGNSGTSSEPHLHIHHTKYDPENLIFNECLPLYFAGTDAAPLPVKGTLVTPD